MVKSLDEGLRLLLVNCQNVKKKPLISQYLPGDPELAHPEVCQLDVALGVQEDVLQLEVPVDDVVPVQEVDGKIQLRRIKPSNI